MKAARSISQDASGVLWLSAGSLSEVMVEVEELEAVRSRAHIPPKVEVEVEVEEVERPCGAAEKGWRMMKRRADAARWALVLGWEE